MISLKEEYFQRMIGGVKLFEFRKAFSSNVQEPFVCAIYLSSPVQAIGGIVEFDRPIKGQIEEILKLARDTNYPFIDGVESYFAGKKKVSLCL